jgi:predicted nucleotidyltransferase
MQQQTLIEYDGTCNNVSYGMIQLLNQQQQQYTRQSLEQLLSDELFDISHLLNVYLFGSRLHGTANEQSDYDIICVMEDGYEKNEKHTLEKRKTALIQSDKADVIVYSKKYFVDRLRQFSIIEFMCLWLPKEYRWKESFSLVNELSNHSTLDLAKFRSSISLQARNKWAMAKNMITEYNDQQQNAKQLYQAKKVIAHSLRIFFLAVQIAKCGKITDYSEGNNYLDANNDKSKLILDTITSDWGTLNSYYKPDYIQLHDQLRKAAPK